MKNPGTYRKISKQPWNSWFCWCNHSYPYPELDLFFREPIFKHTSQKHCLLWALSASLLGEEKYPSADFNSQINNKNTTQITFNLFCFEDIFSICFFFWKFLYTILMFLGICIYDLYIFTVLFIYFIQIIHILQLLFNLIQFSSNNCEELIFFSKIVKMKEKLGKLLCTTFQRWKLWKLL